MDDGWRSGAIQGAYWLKPPGDQAEAAIVVMGALATGGARGLARHDRRPARAPGCWSSPPRTCFTAPGASAWPQPDRTAPSHIESLLAALPPRAGLVTLLDGSPAALSWLGGVDGRRVSPLGVDRFGQTGDLADLYRRYGLDPDAIVHATATLFAS